MLDKTRTSALEWLKAEYKASRYDSPLYEYLWNKHKEAFRVKLKRLYRQALAASKESTDPQETSVANNARASKAYCELISYVIAQLCDSYFLTGKSGQNAGDPKRVESITDSERLDVLLVLGGIRKAACADIRGKATEVGRILAKAQQRLDEDPACVHKCAWQDVHALVDEMLMRDNAPKQRNACELMLEMHEDYLRGDIQLGGASRHTAEAWVASDGFTKPFHRVTKPMVAKSGDSIADELVREGTSSKAARFLAGYYYEGFDGGRVDWSQQHPHLRELFHSKTAFIILVKALLSEEASGMLGKLKPGAKSLDTELLQLCQKKGFVADSQDDLVDLALGAYMSTSTEDSCTNVFVPIAASTDVGGADVPVGVYIAGRERFEALVFSEERDSKLAELGDSKTTVVVFDPYVDQMRVVSRNNRSAFFSLLPQDEDFEFENPNSEFMPIIEFMHQFLTGLHTPSELRRAIHELFGQREEYALACLGRMRKNNGSAPTGLPDELAAFFA